MTMTTIRTSKTILDFGFWILDLKTNNPKSKIQNPKSGECGAALASLLALMTIMAMLMLAAAPNILIDHRRALEMEAIARGEEVAEAIRIFALVRRRLPNNMDELREGISIPGRTKKVMILRQAAAIDPLASDGEWKTVQANETKVLVDFQRKVVNYTGSNAVANPEPKQVFDPILGTILSSIDVETSEDEEPPGGEESGQNVDGPFVGVVSRSQRKAVVAYYGIERHDRWLFTPLLRGSLTGGRMNNNMPPIPVAPPPASVP
jgi:hypothetical protein